MAIDLNKPIGQPAPAAAVLPSKKTMNLLKRERRGRGAGKYVLAALLLAVLVALFAKFAVLDVLAQSGLKSTELAAAQSELASVEAQLQNYDAVLEEYHSYTGISSEGAHDALGVVGLVREVVSPQASVTSVSTSDDTLVINVKGVTLDELGQLADTLKAQELVSGVTVTTAADSATLGGRSSSDEDEPASGERDVAATLQVQLAQAAEGGSENA